MGQCLSGEVQFRYSSTPQDVSNYAAGSDNEIYAVKRVCGTDLKWVTYNVGGGVTETVVPQCSARNGEISDSHATFSGGNSPDFTIDENATLTGTCVNGYGTKTTNPVYKCQQKNASRYIDQFYYAKASGGTCERSCAIPTVGTIFGNGSKYVSGASGTYFEGDLINLACKDGNYGRKLGTPTCTESRASSCRQWNDGQVECGIPGNTDRIRANPTITCKNDGTWEISNDCSACRSCNFLNGNVTITGETEIKDTSNLSCDNGTTNKEGNRVCNFNAYWMKSTLTGTSECKFVSCSPSNRNPQSGTSITCQGDVTADRKNCVSKNMKASITMMCKDGMATVTSLVKIR